MMQKIILSPKHRTTHTYVIGQSGTGKSRAMESWILQDMKAGHGVGLIDPHGDLYDSLVLRLAMHPEIWERVVLINPLDPNWAVNINPLEPIKGLPLERTAAFMTDVMMKIWRLDPTNAPRMLWLVTNTFTALSELGLTLLALPRFLQDMNYRNGLLPKLANQRVRDYFEKEFPTNLETINQWISPALNKIGALIFDPDIRPMLAGGFTLNLRKIMDEQKILLINLSKGLLGEGASSLLGAFIMARLQSMALSRADTRSRLPFYLYMDEFQNYTTDNIKDILTESRKYGLSITFAHQYLEQIPVEIQSAVINTAGSIVSFRVGYQDAQKLAKEIFPSADYLGNKTGRLVVKNAGLWPRLAIETNKEIRNWDRLTHLLSSLKIREFWIIRRGVSYPTKHRTDFLPDVEITPTLEQRRSQLINISGRRFGRLKQEIRREIGDLGTLGPQSNVRQQSTDSDVGVPLWGP